ncbi:MAG: hypothetical protein NBV68_07790 [Erythrobacter sp.]|uniref:hypothetical protein n=1 Tax=Erythrobacter sp. TaxID=1042 RepID=UPI0025D78C38|nr:hypothetical protein [Erythrobacter sp.]MCL9999267.1 hypothetical protein [Erythrobacter sp.]
MRRGAFILALLLAACAGADERAPDTPPTSRPTVVASTAPAPADASSAATPVDCGDERNGGYDNAKACYYDQCNKGDAEACGMAESYNGNLYPDRDPKAVRLEDMTYPEAREVILGMGWIPAGEDCGGGGPAIPPVPTFPRSTTARARGWAIATWRSGAGTAALMC